MTDPADVATAHFVVATFQASAGALLRDGEGRILLLHPTYKSGWTLPGGMLEADETPWQGCRREVLEECGLRVQTGRLAAVDTRPAKKGRSTSLRYLFDCGRVPEGQPIRVQDLEVDDYRFADPRAALTLLRPAVSRRVAAVLASPTRLLYLEDGLPVDAVS